MYTIVQGLTGFLTIVLGVRIYFPILAKSVAELMS